MDYNSIKILASENGLRINDLLALAPANDPFYTGRPSEIEAANWFTGLWKKFGYGNGVHLRRIHYQIVSQDPPATMPNGEKYENTQNCWDFLSNAAKWARYLDLVPADLFVDRRNPEAIINRSLPHPDDWSYEDPTPRYSVVNNIDWMEVYQVPELPELPDLPESLPELPYYQVDGYESIEQPYLIEVWAEKTTMNDVLIPLCKQYRVNIVTGAGELSITAVIDFLKRVEDSGLAARILYVSDFDPAGLGMPISVARKIEFYARNSSYDTKDIALHSIILTPDQIDDYDLPRVPVKDSDKRKNGFETAYGKGQVELDALEALHPGELKRIVEGAILTYYDPTLYRRAVATKHQLFHDLGHERQAILDENYDTSAALEAEYHDIYTDYSETRARFADLIADFQTELNAYRQRLYDVRHTGIEHYATLGDEMNDAAAALDMDDYPLPDTLLPTEPDHLYHSARGYIQQLRYYKAQRNNVKQEQLL